MCEVRDQPVDSGRLPRRPCSKGSQSSIPDFIVVKSLFLSVTSAWPWIRAVAASNGSESLQRPNAWDRFISSPASLTTPKMADHAKCAAGLMGVFVNPYPN